MLDADLIERLNARVADAARRTGASVILSALPQAQTVAVKGPFGLFKMALGAGAAAPVADPAPEPLNAPASRADIAAAERAIGAELPDDLKSLYLCVADGGFGPSDGVLPLADAAREFQTLRAEPQGEYGEEWPAHLLPLVMWDVGCDAYDLRNGKIIRWDPEVLVEAPGRGAFARSFNVAAPSLAQYLEDWLQSSAKESAAIARKTGAGFPGVDPGRLIHLRNCISAMGRMSREELTKMNINLPEGSVEEAWCEYLNLDPAIYIPALKAGD